VALQKFAASVLLLAAACYRANAEGSWLTDPDRPWHVSLGVREEYSDNVDTEDSGAVGSFNTIVNPTLSLDLPLENTHYSFSYDYFLTIYSDPPVTGNAEDAHILALGMSHNFTPRFGFALSDTLVRGIDASLVTDDVTGTRVISKRRGEYWDNTAALDVHYNLTELWTTGVGGFWNLKRFDDPVVVVDVPASDNDRDRYGGSAFLTYQINSRTSAGVQYEYARTIYDESDPLNTNDVPKFRDTRNTQSHAPSVTLIRKLTPKLTLDVDGGVEILYFDDGSQDITPRARAKLIYAYLPGDSVAATFFYGLTTTEVGEFRSAETASVKVDVHHSFTPKLRVSGEVTYTHREFQNPDPAVTPKPTEQSNDGVILSVIMSYRFTRWLSGEAGYTHEETISDFEEEEFARNRVFLGARVTY